MIITEKRFCKTLFVLCLWLLPVLPSAHAQTSRNEVIDDVSIADRSECAVIEVKFSLPMRYRKHFPQEAGNALRVYVEPVAVTAEERELVRRTEYFSPPGSDIVEIAEIIYEGRDVVEPYLSIGFAHPMRFAVSQGSDFRSVVISVFLPDTEKKGCPQ